MLRLSLSFRVPCLLSNQCAQSRRTSSVFTSGSKASSTAQDIQELNDFYPAILDAAKRAVHPFQIPSESKWVERLVEYTVNRVRWPGSIIIYNAMRELTGQLGCAAATELMLKAKYLAWCNELLCASFNVVDDMMDGSVVRYDAPSWHVLPGVGHGAACDAFVLELLGFQVLQQQFKGSPCYADLVDLHMNAMLGATLGQNDDTHVSKAGRAMEDDFTLERYRMMARCKTAYGMFYLPVASALLVCGVLNPQADAAALDISVDLGVLLNMQDDFHDCFGDDSMNSGNDIRNGTCTWMILEAKRVANADQLRILKENYGYDDDSKVDAVKAVFGELSLKKRLLDYRRQLLESVQAKIEKSSHLIPSNIYQYASEVMECNSVEYLKRNEINDETNKSH